MEESIAYESHIQPYLDNRYNLPVNVEYGAHTVCLLKRRKQDFT